MEAIITPTLRSLVIVFFLNGFLFASLPPRYPEIKQVLHINNQQMGNCLLAMSLGGVLTILFTRKYIKKYGALTIVRIGTITVSLIFCIFATVHIPLQLAAAFFLLGIAYQVTDVSMNVIGTMYEKEYNKTILSRLHATFSIGSFTGAFVGAMCATKHIAYSHQFVACSIIALCFASYAAYNFGSLGDNAPLEQMNQDQEHDAHKLNFNWGIVILGIVGFCALFIEGATNDWSTLFLAEAKHIPHAYAGYGFVLFNLAMTCGRLCGDHVRNRLGTARTFITATMITTVALLAVMLLPPYLSMISYSILGIGLATYFPLLISAAATIFPSAPETAVTIVSMITFGSFVCGPPILGSLAHSIGMYEAMWVLPLLSWIILLLLPALVKTIHHAEDNNSHENISDKVLSAEGVH